MSKLSKKEIDYFSEQLPEGVALVDIRNEYQKPIEYGIWDFVQQFYPKYYSCDDIMYNNDISMVVNGEWESSESATQLREVLFHGLNAERVTNPLLSEVTEEQIHDVAKSILIQSNADIYKRAIEGFIEQLKK